MTIKEWLQELTKEEKAKLFALQQEIFNSGKHKDKDFVQKECWNEAVSILTKNINIER